MSSANWVNFFNLGLDRRGTEDLISADHLREVIRNHDGKEAYHSAFDLIDGELKVEEDTGRIDGKGKKVYRYHAQTPETLKRWPKSVAHYSGAHRPAMGYVWLDFDSKDGGETAYKHARECMQWLCHSIENNNVSDRGVLAFFSGSKGFHLAVPFSLFGLDPSNDIGKRLNLLATHLKRARWDSLDTTVFNPQRKFRALGSKHPKTGLYKIRLENLDSSLEAIRELAKQRGSLDIPEAPLLAPWPELAALAPTVSNETISLDEWRRYRQPEGTRALEECEFLAHCVTNKATITEPEWYAAASIVGRFKEGRAKFHAMSKGHAGYSTAATDEKLEQALQASGPRTCSAINTLWGKCINCVHFEKIKSPVVILEKEVIASEATGFYFLDTDAKGSIKRIPDYNGLLKAFQRERPYKTIADMKAVYCFNGTHYEEFTPIEIKSFAEEQFNPKPQEKLRQEFTHKVFANSVTRRAFFSQGTEGKINFLNGILEVDTGLMTSHSADFGFRHVLPYEFDPTATAPTFLWWVNDIMLGDADLVKILQEYMGYVIRGGEYKYHKALWLAGSGRNGKSTFLSVLKSLIGTGNYSTLSIRQIINDKFSSADLDGKIANFSEETSPEELSDSGPFKNLTGDGELNAQKKYGDPYSFRSRAKLIMTYNETPMLKDLSPGMLSRPIIVPFKKDLTAEGAQDRNLKAKLIAELPGIFNFALEGWRRLEEQEDFTRSEKSEFEKEEIRTTSCSAAQWLLENVDFVPLNKADSVAPIAPRTLYDAYKTDTQYAYAERKFQQRINLLKEVQARRRRVEKGTEYFGMKFRAGSAKSYLSNPEF